MPKLVITRKIQPPAMELITSLHAEVRSSPFTFLPPVRFRLLLTEQQADGTLVTMDSMYGFR
jgi:hypothetical protein